jgi:hypothetical protein
MELPLPFFRAGKFRILQATVSKTSERADISMPPHSV